MPRSETSPLPRQREAVEVSFAVHCPETAFGCHVRVVGSCPALGDWDPQQGVPLSTSASLFPTWQTDDLVAFEEDAVEYKYVICDGECRSVQWEERPNRVLDLQHIATRSSLADDGEITITETFNGNDPEEHRYGLGFSDDVADEDNPMKVRAPVVHKMDKEQKLAFIRDLEGNGSVEKGDTVFMVAFSLPVKVQRGEGGKFVVEGQAPTDGRNFAFRPVLEELRQKKHLKVVSVGWPGIHTDNFRERAEIEKLLARYDCIPVFPPREEFESYLNFCTTFLWPVFHDVMLFFQTANPRPFDEQGWAAYTHINNIYANAVVPHTHEGDLIWIHDYHLLMAPTFISRKLRNSNIGFYLHTPFPSSDSFKSLPVREELLSGMLCADQLGFQFFAYARNFLVSCKRIYGLDPTFRAGGFMGLDYNGRLVMLKVAHFVYPFQDSVRVVGNDIVLRKAAEVKALFTGKTVFSCFDRCDGLSGLVPKFRAFKRFVQDHPKYLGKAVLVQYVFESAAGKLEGDSALLEALRSQADAFLQPDDQGALRLVGRSEGGPAPDLDKVSIVLRAAKLDRTDRLALFKASDVLLDTSVKAGLNLMPFEFITAHASDANPQTAVIVSEFSGCSRVLLGALRVNPWNTAEVVGACDRALTMAPTERSERVESNLHYLADSSPIGWFEDFLTDLRRARKKEGTRIETMGFGTKIRQVCVGQDFTELPISQVLAAYRNAKNRVLFLDNEGTLAADKRRIYREYGAPKGNVSDLKSHGTAPDEHILNCLKTLAADTRNTVMILSGRDKSMLEEWFGSVPKLGLAAERGFYYKLPLTGNQWHCMLHTVDNTWKSYAFEIMRQFVKRTQGSFIENKGSALVWQYRDADQHFGSWQAKELSSHLKELLFGFDVEVIDGKGYVEVKLRGINKGVAVTKVLGKVAQAFGEVDFVLCIGDDRSDEDMFEALNLFVDPSEEVNDAASQQSTTDGQQSDHSENAPERQPSVSKNESNLSGLQYGTTSAGPPGTPSPSSARLKGGSSMNLAGLFGRQNSSSLPRKSSDQLLSRRFFTCTVGMKPSAAKFFLNDVDEVSELLTSLKSENDKRASRDANSQTWSAGGDRRRAGRVSSMPALSSLAFGEDAE